MTDSNRIPAHLLLELMPELRWLDIPLVFIFNPVNIVPHVLIWQTAALWMPVGSRCDLLSLRPGTACLTAGVHAELESSWWTVQGSHGIWGRFYSTDYTEAERVAWQTCSQVLPVSCQWTTSCLCARNQCSPPTRQSLQTPSLWGTSSIFVFIWG